MLKYLLTSLVVLSSIIGYSQYTVYTGFGLGGSILTADEDTYLLPSRYDHGADSRYTIVVEKTLHQKFYSGIRVSYSQLHNQIKGLSYPEKNDISSTLLFGEKALSQKKITSTIYGGVFLIKNFSVDGGFSLINNVTNKLTGLKRDYKEKAFITYTNLDNLKYGSSHSFGWQFGLNYHIEIGSLKIVPSLRFISENRTDIGVDSDLKLGVRHYIGELKIGYTLQTKRDDK